MGQNLFKNSKDNNSNKKDEKSLKKNQIQNDALLKKIAETLELLKEYDLDDTSEFETKQTRELFFCIDDAYNTHRKLHDQITDLLLKHNYLQVAYPFLLHYADQGYIQRQGIYLSASNILNTIWSATSESFEFRKVC
jgi:hypothetical protein